MCMSVSLSVMCMFHGEWEYNMYNNIILIYRYNTQNRKFIVKYYTVSTSTSMPSYNNVVLSTHECLFTYHVTVVMPLSPLSVRSHGWGITTTGIGNEGHMANGMVMTKDNSTMVI